MSATKLECSIQARYAWLVVPELATPLVFSASFSRKGGGGGIKVPTDLTISKMHFLTRENETWQHPGYNPRADPYLEKKRKPEEKVRFAIEAKSYNE